MTDPPRGSNGNAENAIWTASRLNEETAKAGDSSLGFAPSGATFQQEPGKHFGELAVVFPVTVGAAGFVAQNLSTLPPTLMLLALNPEPWCVTIIRPEARRSVGPFRNVAAPLREWLLRAAQADGGVAIAKVEAASAIEQKDPGFLPLLELVPARARFEHDWLLQFLETLNLRRLGHDVRSEPDAVALMAGLWLMNDFLDRSHEFSQSIEGKGRNRSGDYWHGILHRREPDYSNAKYWFRHVGSHPIHASLANQAAEILREYNSQLAKPLQASLSEGRWDPFAFVDFCKRAEIEGNSDLSELAQEIQMIEMTLLLVSTYHDAVA